MKQGSRYVFGAAVAGTFLCGIPGLLQQASADVLINETFDSYTPATALVGQGPWLQTGTSNATPIQVTASGLGNVATLGTSGQDVYAGFGGNEILHTTGQSAETSLTINVASAQATGDYFSHLSDILGSTSDFFSV